MQSFFHDGSYFFSIFQDKLRRKPQNSNICFTNRPHHRQIDVYRTVRLSYDAVGRGLAPAVSAPQEQRKYLTTLHEFALKRYKFVILRRRREQAPALRW